MESTLSPRRVRLALLACSLFLAGCSLGATEDRAAPPPPEEIALEPAIYGDAVIFHPAGAILRDKPGDHQESLGILSDGAMVARTGRIYRFEGVDWYEVAIPNMVGWINGLHMSDPVPQTPADVLGEQVERDDASTETAAEIEATSMVTVYPGANIRQEPEGTIIAEVLYGTPLAPTGEELGGWAEVTFEGGTGWIFATLMGPLVDDSATTEARADAEAGQVMVAPGQAGVNIRAVPGGAVVGAIPAGEVATTTGVTDGGWTEVTYDGVTGWSFSEILVPA